MKEYHPPLGDRSGLRLDFNENTFACSPRVLDALGRISRGDLTRYPEREPRGARRGRRISVSIRRNCLLTNGVDEAIHLLCQTYLEAGTEILLPVPTYTMYEVYASGTPARVVQVPAEDGFRFPLTAVLDAVTPATRLIAIANPNSPTGQAARREDLLRIVEAAPHAAVLVDEAYFHFFGETVLDLVGRAPNVIVARTFSKAYGLAGLAARAFCAAAEEPDAAGFVEPSLLTASIPSRWSVWPQRSTTKTIFAGTSVKFSLRGPSLKPRCERLGVPYWPSQANFVLVGHRPKTRPIRQAMRTRGVLVRDRSSDPGCDGCVRITLGTQ